MILPSSLLSSCDAKKKNEELYIVTTVFPPYDLARNIGGEHCRVEMLLAPSQDIHSYEPSIADIAKISQADIFIYTSEEEWIKNTLENLKDKDIKTVEMLSLTEGEGHSHSDTENGHEDGACAGDEHVWTSPKNAIIITNAIYDAMIEKDGKNGGIYKENKESCIDKLNSLEKEFSEIAASPKRRVAVFAERFPFSHLFCEYGLSHISAFEGCSSESEPSLNKISELIAAIKKDDIPVIFNIEFSDGAVAKSIADATGAEILTLHSCHNLSKEEIERGEDYISLMKQNAENLRKALN